MITIKNPIKNIPSGMVLKRRILHLVTPIGLQNRVFRAWKKPSERFSVLRLVSYIAIQQRKEHKAANMFVNIYCRTLGNTGSKNYASYLTWLMLENIIEINTKYKTDNDSYTKSFRFTDRIFRKEFTATKWDTEELQNTMETIKTIESESVLTPDGKYDNELLYCLEHERLLTVPDADYVIENRLEASKWDMPFAMAEASMYFNAINAGDMVPTEQDRSSRFYLNSIMMPRSLRKFLRYGKSNSKLVNYDIATAYPYFLKLLVSFKDKDNKDMDIFNCVINPHRQNCLDSFYKEDFYNRILENSIYKNREEVKTAFNAYRNSERTIKETHPITKRLVEIGEGDMAKYIVDTDNLWKVLETMETELMCKLCNECITRDLVFIRAHDGFLTTQEHVEEVNQILSEHPFNAFRFKSETL